MNQDKINNTPENLDEDFLLDWDDEKVEQRASQVKEKIKNRIEKLSEKVILTSKEKEEALKKAQAEEEARRQIERERDFYKDFSANLASYPAAAEFQDKIFEKVKSGYNTEDAILAVLAKEGKLASPQSDSTKTMEPNQKTELGGSAPNLDIEEKDLSNMSLEEKRQKLIEASETGELESLLRSR